MGALILTKLSVITKGNVYIAYEKSRKARAQASHAVRFRPCEDGEVLGLINKRRFNTVCITNPFTVGIKQIHESV